MDSVKECTGKNNSKFLDYIDIANIIIDHHNNYKKETEAGNFYDFMSIIPTHFSIMTAGFFAGLENARNRDKVRIHRAMLQGYAYDIVDRLNSIKITNE